MTDEVRQEDARWALGIAVEAADQAGVASDHPYRTLLENVGFRAALLARHASPLRTRIAEIEGALTALTGKLEGEIEDRFRTYLADEMRRARATLNGEKKHG